MLLRERSVKICDRNANAMSLKDLFLSDNDDDNNNDVVDDDD